VNIVRRNCRLFQHNRPKADIPIGSMSAAKLGGETYDREAPERIKALLY
jgi:hypothetical protein